MGSTNILFVGFTFYDYIIIFCGHLYFIIDLNEYKGNFKLSDIPTPFTIFIFPILFTLLGMLLMPIANLCDRKIIGKIWKLIFRKRQELNKEESEALEKAITQKLCDEYDIEVSNIYHFCKDYIDQKQSNANFMVFLARFGFYRNVAFMCFVSAVATPFVFGLDYVGFIVVGIWISLMIIFKNRSHDFYSYLAPTVYRSFLGCQLSDLVDLKKTHNKANAVDAKNSATD